MLSKSQIKLITSLGRKKYRNQNQLFVVEGIKSTYEFLNSEYELEKIYSTKADVFNVDESKFCFISDHELKKISFLSTPNIALATFHMKAVKQVNFKKLILGLDAISDPGNLGTIIRLCDWFGISDLVCSLDTVDCYNPKVVQSSMGSLARVNISYLELEQFLIDNSDIPVYGTFMTGENVYEVNLEEYGILILGNEANGIRNNIEKYITEKLTIPQFNSNQNTESLNVAMASAIFLSEFKRRFIER